MKIEIKCRFSGSVLFAHEQTDNTMILTLEAAVKARANLDGANLDGKTLTKPPISLINLTWPVLITDGYMRIGCQRHTHDEWRAFDNSVIAAMEPRAADFWGRWGAVLLAMCDAHKGAA